VLTAVRLVTIPIGRTAAAGFRDFSVWPDAVLSMKAPEQSFIRVRHTRIVVREDELSLPS